MSRIRPVHIPPQASGPRAGRVRDGRTAVAGAVFWGLLGAGLCAWIARLEPNLLEEGMLLHVAQRLVAGERLYTDVLAFTGPLPFEGLALLFRWLGADVAVARGALSVLTGLACAAAWGIGRRAGAGPLAHLVAAVLAVAPVLGFPLYTVYFYTTLALHGSVIATFVALRGRDSSRWAAAAGLLVAGVALCKQTFGVGLAVAFGIVYLLDRRNDLRLRRVAAFASGGAIATALTLAVYAVRGELGALAHGLIVLPLSFESAFDTPFVNFWPPGRFTPGIAADQGNYLPFLYMVLAPASDSPGRAIVVLTQLLFALPGLAVVGTLVRRGLGGVPFGVWLHLGLLCTLATNLHPRSDWGHLVYVLPAACAQLVLLAARPAGAPAPRPVARAIAAVGAAVLCASAGLAGLRLDRAAGSADYGPHVSVRPVSAPLRAPYVPDVIAYLRARTDEGEGLFVARAEPLIYFATGLRNPTPYSGVLPAMQAEQERVVLDGLASVDYAVMSDLDGPTYTYYARTLPAVQRYLERHFRIPEQFTADPVAWIHVLERVPDRGETVLDLYDAREDGRAWIRDAEGRVRRAASVPLPVAVRHDRRPLVFRVGPRGGGIDFEVDVPPDAVLQADAGLGYVRLGGRVVPHAMPADLVVSIGPPGAIAPVASVRVEGEEAVRRTWTPVQVDLSPWAGSRVVVRLELVPDEPLEHRTVGWWGSPRIARRASPATPTR